MKVLFVTSELYPWVRGGPQNVVYNLANHLAGEVDLSVLCIEPGPGPQLEQYYRDDISFTLIADKGRGATKYPYRNLAYVKKAAEAGKQDLVHFHILPGANCFLLPPRLKRYGTPLVLSLYDWVPDELEFYAAMERFRHILHWQVARHGLRRFDRYVVNSTYMCNVVKEYGLEEVEIMPNGIDAAQWRNVERISLRGSENVLFWGRLYDKKGVGELLGAFASCARESSGVHLYIGGEGPEGDRYRKLACDLGIEPRVTFLGALGDSELKRYIASCDLCVFPSVYEGFGISILEAMAAAKAVVTSARGGQADFARDGFNARLARLDVPGDLARVMGEVLDDAGLRESLGERAAKTAEEYDWPRIARGYKAYYERVMEGV